jgi:hypothetical protein
MVLLEKFFLKLSFVAKRLAKRPERSLRKFWITPSYVLNLTYKSKGARMGKGKGKKTVRTARFFPGKPFLEFSNVRSGKIFYFIKFLNLYTFNKFYCVMNYHPSACRNFPKSHPTQTLFFVK